MLSSNVLRPEDPAVITAFGHYMLNSLYSNEAFIVLHDGYSTHRADRDASDARVHMEMLFHRICVSRMKDPINFDHSPFQLPHSSKVFWIALL
jgi:hypothetical protein